MAKEDKQGYTYVYEGSNYQIPREDVGRLTKDEKEAIVNHIIQYGIPANDEAWAELFKNSTNNPNAYGTKSDGGYRWLHGAIKEWAIKFINYNKGTLGYNSDGYAVDWRGNIIKDADGNNIKYEDYSPQRQQNLENAQDILYNDYWNNLYQRDSENTLGNQAYNELLQAEQNAAKSSIDLANAQAQQLGMAQAQTVKNITDQLKAERMSMLRAGMSESQIASQDMQNMITNTNALNEQIAAANIAALQGQQQYQSAEQTAYQNWLNAMNQTGANASAMAASDAGDLYQQTLKRMKQTGENYKAASNNVSGQKSQ